MKNILFNILLFSFICWSCSAPEETQTNTEDLVKSVNVHVTEVQPRNFKSYVKLVGTITSDSDVEVAAEATGNVLKYFVEKGQRVKKGDPILKIDDQELLAEKDRLEAVTESSYENYKRLDNLLNEDGIGSEIDVINARSQYLQNKASLDAVNIQIKKTLVKAPFDAVLEEKLVEEGEMASAALGTLLFRLVSADILKVKVGVPARYADVIKPGSPSKIWFDTNSSDTLSAPISFVGNSIDPQSRTFTAEIPIPNRVQYKIDMIANVRLQTNEQSGVIIVGQQIIKQKDNGEFVVYIKGEHSGHDIALERNIKLGPMFQNSVVVTEGLERNDPLITTGFSFLQDSMRINVVKTEQRTFANNSQ